MKIHETLERDPLQSSLANNGQARIVAHADERSEQELRAELETFVCDGQYGDAIQKILDSYLTQLDRPRQNAAWIGGFYGSGKSHLLKMLGHLWVNTPFSDGAAARTLVPELPDEVKAQLRELDMAATRTGLAQIAAANTLPSGVGDQVRRTVLGVILHACGLPTQYPQAQFCFWLREEGYLDHVRDAVKREGRDWFHELNNLYVSPIIAQAVLECDPNFAADEREARQVLRSRFPDRPGDITTAEFIEATRQALAPQGEMPVTVLLLDEVQEYIGDSRDRVVAITELVEAIQTQLDSRVMVVMSGQSALSGTQLLQKMQDRFRIQVQLSDADVEAVTRKVLLRKKPKAVEPIRNELERNAGEISKHLQGTKLAEQPEDQGVLVPDYPLLPTRRRFWEETFRAVDAAGTHSQLRSQLRIIYDALHKVAEEDVGALIPGDALFEAIAPDLVNTGVLLNEISTRIEELDDGTEEGRLRKRIVSLVFLINKLPREEGVDVGLRATPRMIADLLVADLSSDSGPLRRQVEEQLEALQADGELMKVDEEYRLQTTEGAEWDRAFRERLAALSSGDAEIERKRQQLLAKEVQAAIDEVDLKHGDSKLRRKLYLHAGTGDPPTDTDQVVVWLQDGWSVPRTDVEEEARRRGLD
ncbi:MAG: BREX system P-loop protein BrxC, partial [Salinibacter sp.]